MHLREARELRFTKRGNAFLYAKDDVEQVFKPSFNTLNLFTVPQLHSVSMVANYVTAERLAVTGWFRVDDPPQPFG